MFEVGCALTWPGLVLCLGHLLVEIFAAFVTC